MQAAPTPRCADPSAGGELPAADSLASTPLPWRGGRRPGWVTGSATLLAALLTLAAGCRQRERAEAAAVEPATLTEDLSWGPVEFVLTATPAKVDLRRDTILTLRLTTPAGVEATLPPLEDRAQGFTLGGAIPREPVTQDGKTTRIQQVRLTPVLANEYRLAPLAVRYTDRRQAPSVDSWFPTRPIVFAVTPPLTGKTPDDIAVTLKPRWIPPTARTVLLWVALAAALLAGAYGLFRLFTRVRREQALRRLSPRERALRELADLLAKKLIEHGHPQDFYVELTMVVRRYIERVHAIRAPEQTTEEFLRAVAEDRRFAPEVVRTLRSFLEAADLVKFAAYVPGNAAVDQSVATARAYVETDSAAAAAAAQEEGGAPPAR